MSLPNNPLCPVCRMAMSQAIPGDQNVWTCPNHGDFTGGTGNSATSGATVQSDAEAASGATSGDLVPGL